MRRDLLLADFIRGQLRLFASLLISAALAASALAQTTVTLQQGLNAYTGTVDSKIDCCSFANTNYGADPTYALITDSSTALLVHFNIFAAEGGPVPAGATITSATLKFYKFGGPASTFAAYRVLKNWTELGVTWSATGTGTSWSTLGVFAGDILSTADGTASIGDATTNGCTSSPFPDACWLKLDVTAGVQAFASGASTNFGWKVSDTSGTSGTPREFNSKDNTSWPTLRPILVVTYNSAPPPPSCASGSLRPYDQAPISGQPISISSSAATTFEAEHFNCGGQNVAYHDNTAGNQGGAFRTGEDVDIITSTGAANGSYVINNFETNEWLTYTINVTTAGNYDIAVRASNNIGSTVTHHIDIDTTGTGSSYVNKGTIPITGTGGWDTFGWFTLQAVALTAGQQVLRLYADSQWANVDQIQLTPSGSPPPPPPPSGDDCTRSGLDLCVRFEATETQKCSGTDCSVLLTQSVGGATVTWSALNRAFDQPVAPDGSCNGDRVDDPRRLDIVAGGIDGSSALKLTTQVGDNCVHSSNPYERSQLNLAQNYGAVTEQWWAYSTFFPTGAFNPTSNNYDWYLFSQFHHNASCSLQNFSLDIFMQPGNSPKHVIRATAHGGACETNLMTYSVPGASGIQGQCIHDTWQTGVWYDFVQHVRWAYDGTGLHELWMREAGGPVKKVLELFNKNTLYSGDTTYFVLTNYHPAPGVASSVIHDRIRRSTLTGDAGFNAVAPPNFVRPSPDPVVMCSGATSP